jgi:hypothetical protein
LGAEAHAFGWTAPELFALHPEHGTLQIDYCGVLMNSGNRPQAVEPTRLMFDRGSAYRNKRGQLWGCRLARRAVCRRTARLSGG